MLLDQEIDKCVKQMKGYKGTKSKSRKFTKTKAGYVEEQLTEQEQRKIDNAWSSYASEYYCGKMF